MYNMNSSMRFVTDLTKGILGNADETALWNQILSYIPDDVLMKPDIRILCPACGHGTEIDMLVCRMIKLGIDKETIKSSIYVLDKYNVFTNPMKRKGYVNVFTEDFLIWDPGMKFDVIIGNPPYNWSDGDKQRKNNRENLWTRFITKSFEELAADDGYVAMVVPKTWMSPSKDYGTTSILNDYFKPNQVLVMNIDECARHFNVGSSFSYFVAKKNYANSAEPTRVITPNDSFDIDLNDDTWNMGIPSVLNREMFSIVKKVFNPKLKKFNWEKQYTGQVNDFVENGNYEVFHTPAKKGKTFSNSKSMLHDNKKVMVSLSGKYAPYYDDGNCSPSGMIVCLLLHENETVDNARTVFDSKIYKLMIDVVFRYNGWINGNALKSLPALDLTRSWTEDDIYKHFNLTQEEIVYVNTIAT